MSATTPSSNEGHSKGSHPKSVSRPNTMARRSTKGAVVATFFLVISSSSWTTMGSAFQLNMVATSRRHATEPSPSSLSTSKPPFAPSTQRRTVTVPRLPSSPSSQGGGVTSSLISQMAVVALKLRLADETGVKCDVTARSSDLLLKGRVGPVTVRGRGWNSQLGLKCRMIEATVQRCDLDMRSVLTRGKLKLITPARGDAMIAMNGEDFGSFITHPLMKPPAVPRSVRGGDGGDGIEFIREGVWIDPTDGGGTVKFYINYMGMKWGCALTRGGGGSRAGRGAVISVAPPAASVSLTDGNDEEREQLHLISAELTGVLSEFFNEMVFELDGTFLSFRDMMVTNKGEGAASIMMSLAITVHKFPSPGLEF